MPRKPGEPRKQFTSTMKEHLYVALQDRSERTGVPISRLRDKAVGDYLHLQLLNEAIRVHPNT